MSNQQTMREKEEFLQMMENAMTVGEIIEKLEHFDKNMIVINGRDKHYRPISSVEKTNVDYCFDEIIKKEVIEIW